MSFADDIQDMAGQSLRTTAWSARAVYQGLLVMATPGSPPAGESGVGHFSCPAEATRAKSWVLAARVLKRGDVGGSCLDWPGCASFVHVGPPVGFGVWFSVSLQPRPDVNHLPAVSHLLKPYRRFQGRPIRRAISQRPARYAALGVYLPARVGLSHPPAHKRLLQEGVPSWLPLVWDGGHGDRRTSFLLRDLGLPQDERDSARRRLRMLPRRAC